MKTILLIGPLPPPIGGDTVSFQRLIENKYLKNYNKIVIDTSRKGNIRLTGRKIDLHDLLNGLRVIREVLRNIKGSKTILLWANRRFLYTVGLCIILIAKLNKRKIICKIFGGSFHTEFNQLPVIYKYVAKWILDKADYILPQTKALCKYFINYLRFKPQQVIHFPNYIPEDIYEDGLRIVPLKNNNLRCIFVGQVKEEKGVFDILEVLKKCNYISCDFYGPILERDQEKFISITNNLKNAQYKGIVEAEKVCETIGHYNILLLPSFYKGEGYPAVVLEAFNSARPVLATDWMALPEMIEDKKDGFLVPINSPDAIVDKLHYIINNNEVYLKMCFQAKEKAYLFSEKRVLQDVLMPLIDK